MDSNSTRGLVLVREFHPDKVVPGQKNHDSYGSTSPFYLVHRLASGAIILDPLDHVGA
jgi:hypothetical protein